MNDPDIEHTTLTVTAIGMELHEPSLCQRFEETYRPPPAPGPDWDGGPSGFASDLAVGDYPTTGELVLDALMVIAAIAIVLLVFPVWAVVAIWAAFRRTGGAA